MRNSTSYNPTSSPSFEEIGYNALVASLECLVISTVPVGSDRVGAAFHLSLSERETPGTVDGAGRFTAAASQTIALWVGGLLPILYELRRLFEGEIGNGVKVRGAVSSVRRHVKRWQPQTKWGDSARRLGDYDSSRHPSTAKDYDTLRQLVKELKTLCTLEAHSKGGRAFLQLLNDLVTSEKITEDRKTAMVKQMQEYLRGFSGLDSSLTAGMSVELIGFEDPWETNSFWSLACSGSLSSEPKLEVPGGIAGSVAKSEGKFSLRQEFDQPLEVADQAIGSFLSFCDSFMIGDSGSRLHSLSSKASDLNSQLTSRLVLPNLKDERRQYFSGLLSKVASTFADQARNPSESASRTN